MSWISAEFQCRVKFRFKALNSKYRSFYKAQCSLLRKHKRSAYKMYICLVIPRNAQTYNTLQSYIYFCSNVIWDVQGNPTIVSYYKISDLKENFSNISGNSQVSFVVTNAACIPLLIYLLCHNFFAVEAGHKIILIWLYWRTIFVFYMPFFIIRSKNNNKKKLFI